MRWDVRRWIRRYLDRPPERFNERIAARPNESARRAELGLLERQTRAAEANVRATIALTGALLVVASCQWRTSAETAALERAKATPRFRVDHTADTDVTEGFLAKSLSVLPISGVSATTEASVRQIVLIHYHSGTLKLGGICRASISGFYGFGRNLLEWSETDAAEGLLTLGRGVDDGSPIFLQPVSTIIGVDFYDLYGRPKHQNLNFRGGVATPIDGDPRRNGGWSNIDLHIQLAPSGDIWIFRKNRNDITQDCADALRVLQTVPSVRIARYYFFDENSGLVFYNEPPFDDSENGLITTKTPAPQVQ